MVAPVTDSVHRGMLFLMVLMLWLMTPWAMAGEQDIPSRQSIDEQIGQIEGNDPQSAADQQALETLNQTREALEALEKTQKEQAALEDRVNQADRQRRQYQNQLQGLESDRALDSEALGRSSLEQIEQRLGSTVEDLQRQQEQLSEVTRALISAQTLPERVQATISDARREQQQLGDSLDSGDGNAPSSERRQLVNTRMALLEASIELGQRQLANSTILRDVNQVHRELLARQIDINQNALLVLQEAINQKRRDASEQAIAEAAHVGESDRVSNPVVDEARAQNQALAQELLRTTDRANTMIRDGINTRARLEQVRQVERTLNEQIQALRGSLLLSRVLRQQRGSLPDVENQRSLQEEIGDLRLRQFDVGQSRQALTNPARYIEEHSDVEKPLPPRARQALLQTLEMRRDLLDQLDREYGNLLSRAIDVQLNQQQLLDISRSVRDTIEEQLFWVANGQPLGLSWLGDLPERLGEQLLGGEWLQTLRSLWALPSPQALLAAPLLIVAGLMAFFRRRIKAYLLELHNQIGRLKRDTQLHTPRAIALNLVLSSTLPLILLAAGIALWLGGEGFAISLGRALLQLALALQVFGLIRRLLVPDGVAMRHFHWPAPYVDRLRRNIFWLGCSVAPVVVVASIAEQADSRLAEQPLALLVMLAGLMGMSVFMLRLILAHVPWMGVRLFRLLLGITLAMVPLALIGMILFGYEYTALRLCGRFILTLYILALWLLVEASVVRGLAVAARRLAYRRAVTRRRAQGRDGAAESGVELVEEPPLDMEQVNQQSLRLSKLILFLIFISVLYLVWADLLGVLSYLDNVSIGQIEEGDAAGGAVNVVTLADVMTALIIVGLMVIMARNLPGLLEVMVLSRLNLKQGSAYAVTSLLSYTIVGGGIVAALGTLGVTWDKLQWLVAALSVGLGFGLQEIFANFISGLIILFERPIRIGDTITLGNLHGTVSRIRIRATTVTDFDRKEIIIPNKTFVTDQLINWSLTDNITRVVLTFGVAHGTDLDLAHRILRRIADEHPKVLVDPEPQVFCMAYSQDAFNFELRVFVNELIDRLVVTDEINRRVDAEFRSNGLRVAFQQMDVWLHNEEGEKRLVQQKATRDGRPSPHASSAHDGDPGDASPGDATPGELP
ncbi:mechanosensitive channel MscK [Kushneria indalinina]|uniref:Potassium efflux system protein n=1 Tax=Kushneria indalinina DSM 14324 TaxID=1122140 RepID=A0A3D9DVT0_9GAMM|nr:mechanosensitive channel MscK [Kushneria indalinina]REC94499.1 potassium efflux system protein [Kushneria indalinina DSM 14324]